MNIRVDRARPDELEAVLAIGDEAARWLLARNIRQWESPPSEQVRETIRRGIADGDVYLVRPDGSPEPFAIFRMEWQGAPLWPDERNAGYLYSLGLRPGFVGRGLGAAILEHVKRWLASEGKDCLRLDCIAGNATLRRWYEGLGFHYRGLATVEQFTLALYEIELAGVLGSKPDEAI